MCCGPSSCGRRLATTTRRERRRTCSGSTRWSRPDTAGSACLEIEWWRVHRVAQQAAAGASTELVDALTRLYAFVFGVPESAVRPAAFHRCRAMEISDQWVTLGSRSDSPLIAWERTVLIRSYKALLAAVGG